MKAETEYSIYFKPHTCIIQQPTVQCASQMFSYTCIYKSHMKQWVFLNTHIYTCTHMLIDEKY